MRKVVVFHGWANATTPALDFIMREFQSLIQSPTIAVSFPQSPFPVPADDYVAVCRRYRLMEESVIMHTRNNPHYTWWDWRPRSNDPPVPPGTYYYRGLEDCVVPYLKEYFSMFGPFDAIVGFSQGALLAVILATMAAAKRDGYECFATKGVCVVGPPSPVESARHVELFREHEVSAKSLVLLGDKDRIAEKRGHGIVTQFTDPLVVRYPGGHHFPRDEATKKCLAAG